MDQLRSVASSGFSTVAQNTKVSPIRSTMSNPHPTTVTWVESRTETETIVATVTLETRPTMPLTSFLAAEDSKAMSSPTASPSNTSVVDTYSFKVGVAVACAAAAVLVACFAAWLTRRRRQQVGRPMSADKSPSRRRGALFSRRPMSSILVCPRDAHVGERRDALKSFLGSYYHNDNTTWSMQTPEDPYRIIQDTPMEETVERDPSKSHREQDAVSEVSTAPKVDDEHAPTPPPRAEARNAPQHWSMF